MRKHKPTLAEIARDLRDAPPAPLGKANVVRPGGYNAAGEFFDPAGTELSESYATVTPHEALALARAGAVVAFEGCGCGGGAGCPIEWYGPADVRAMIVAGPPAFVKGNGSPTWIDVWSGGETTLVFAHGNVRWSNYMA